MSAIQSQLAGMTKEQLIERIQKMERLCQASAVDATEQAQKVAELEASLQSTENYWKSKYELEVDKVADLQKVLKASHKTDKDNWDLKRELEGFKSICNEYLSGPEATWQDLSNWCEEKTDEIVDLNEEMGQLEGKSEDFEYDLQSLQSDLEQLDTLMDDLYGVSEYDDIAHLIKEIQSVISTAEKTPDGYYEHHETKQIADMLEGVFPEKS